MHPNARLIVDFYDAFSRLDGASMATAYHSRARFSDPVFTDLDAEAAGAMWQMLCQSGADLRVEASQIEADDHRGHAHWEAWYTFLPTKRKVHNVIDATFSFEEGQIIAHSDSFDFQRWSRQALGLPAVLLGWTSLPHWIVRSQAQKSLALWRQKNQK